MMTEHSLPSWLCEDCRVMLDSGKSNIHVRFWLLWATLLLWWVFGALWISKTQAWWKIALAGLFEWRHWREVLLKAAVSAIYSSFTVSDLTIRMLDSTWLPSSATYLPVYRSFSFKILHTVECVSKVILANLYTWTHLLTRTSYWDFEASKGCLHILVSPLCASH